MQTRPNSANNPQPNADNNGQGGRLAASQQAAVTQPSGIAPAKGSRPAQSEAFDQPVVLKQTPLWSRAILWGIVGVVTFGFTWACLAKVEEAVPATGELKPQGSVQELQPPVSGKVVEVLVEDGDRVSEGDLLVRLDPAASESDLETLAQVQKSLIAENQFYRSQLSGAEVPSPVELAQLNIPPEVLALTSSRLAIVEENQLYASLLTGDSSASLDPIQRIRLGELRNEATSRIAASELEVEQLRRQLGQTQRQIATAQETFNIEQGILEQIAPLVEEGALADIQLKQQQVEALNRQGELDRLVQEERVLRASIAQAEQQRNNTVSASRSDILNRMAENDKSLAQIDSELNKRIVENDKRIAEIRGQLEQTELQLSYQELRSPIDGVVFDLQAQENGFVTANPEAPVLKVVPGDALIAEVFITNQDIGFVDVGMPVDVRIDTFPFSEFGDVEGELVSIGADALPPTQVRQFYAFPAKVELDQQFVNISGNPIELQSGMSITGNIKIRKRRVITLFTDLFVKKIETLKTR
ncbi:MAG: HlyD family efflux transporter periplasmic adaptor subunit [Cyanobacteria bacterium P01_A01_bin.135]